MKDQKKLTLNKKTIANLKSDELTEVKGGWTITMSDCSVLTCDSHGNSKYCLTLWCNTGSRLCQNSRDNVCPTHDARCNPSNNFGCTNTKFNPF